VIDVPELVKQDRRHVRAEAMALFFDAQWFDACLDERGLSRAVMAAAAGLTPTELALVFKDQRELSAGDVAVFAELLGVDITEVASRAGVSTPVPGQAGPLNAKLAALERRVVALEAQVAKLKGG
jgi:hypothetical protein